MDREAEYARRIEAMERGIDKMIDVLEQQGKLLIKLAKIVTGEDVEHWRDKNREELT